MLNYYLTFTDIAPWAVLIWSICVLIGKWKIFKKLGIRPIKSIIPVVSQYSVYNKIWRPLPFLLLSLVAVTCASFLGAYYNDTTKLSPLINSQLLVIMIAALMLITLLMYKRIAFVFGHEVGYFLGLIFLNPIFLLYIGFSKAMPDTERYPLKGKELRTFQKEHRTKKQRIFNVFATIFVILAMLGDGVYMFFTEHPRWMINFLKNEFAEKYYSAPLSADNVVYPAEDARGIDYSDFRDHYFEDKSGVSDTVVYFYCVGSDLENNGGSASLNIAQMLLATKNTDNLKFVIEAGGSFRWFTKGMKNGVHARYVIENGKISHVMDLEKISMAEPEVLADFLCWANENYPADRKMLFFWNHGGGMVGFGKDDMYLRSDGGKYLSVPDIADALKKSGAKYDIISFDACLMQTIEIGIAMEPYCDYLLGSEETEPGYGQYYIDGFKALAEDPTMSSVDFGSIMISNYDYYNTMENDGEPDPSITLSLVDVRQLPGIYDDFTAWFGEYSEYFADYRYLYLAMASGVADTYEFAIEDHYDMADLITLLDMDDGYTEDLVNRINSAVMVRNSGSGENIHGLSCYVPYHYIALYDYAYDSLNKLGLGEQASSLNNFASIVALHSGEDYSGCDWYVPGFEDVDTVLLSDVELIPEDDAYRIGFTKPDFGNDIEFTDLDLASGVSLSLLLQSKARYADLGRDSLFTYSDDEGYWLDYDGTWVTINGYPVPVNEIKTQVTDSCTTTLFTVPARLNLVKPITIYIKRNIYENGEINFNVVGYADSTEDVTGDDEDISIETFTTERNCTPFKTGSFISIMYNWYNSDLELIGESMGHLPIRIGSGGLDVAQGDISKEGYVFAAVVTDVLDQEYSTDYLLHEKP